MAREVYRFGVTIPAGTARGAPQVTPLSMPERVVSRIEVLIPPGPRGNVGFQLASSGAQMIPVNLGQYVVSDDEKLGWDLSGQITSGAWQMIAYNVGQFAHTIEVRFLTDVIPDESAAGLWGPIDNGRLSSFESARPAGAQIAGLSG